jgi:hypothetical protein
MADFTQVAKEKTTQKLTAVIKDETGAIIPGASLSTLTVTLYDTATNAIINSRNNQSILGANGGSVDSSGNLAWIMDPADNVILNDALAQEIHVALLVWTYAAGAKRGEYEIALIVPNTVRVS